MGTGFRFTLALALLVLVQYGHTWALILALGLLFLGLESQAMVLRDWHEQLQRFQALMSPPAAIAPEPAQAPLVHVLHQGQALCGQPGTPNTWPPGESWVSLDLAYDLGSRVTCLGCKSRVNDRMHASS